MFGKLFGKKGQDGDLPKPKDINEFVGRHLVVRLGENPDWVWKLKGVNLPDPSRPKRFQYRVFDADAANARGVVVKNYHGLDQHPDLVLYHGYVDLETKDMEVNPGPGPAVGGSSRKKAA